VKSALIIIDIQQALFTDESPKYDSFGVVSRLNKLARDVRTSGGAVIFVQHDGPEGDPLHPASPGWRLLESLNAEPE